MRKNSVIFLGLAVIMAFILGCGGGGGTTASDDSTTTVTVERGPVYDALVRDANGQIARNTPNSNRYVFATPPVYPITATGGYVDVNYDGVIDTNDFPLSVVLKTDRGLNITAMTTYLSELNDTDRQALADSLGVSLDELYALPSEASGEVVAAINAAFAAVYTLNYDESADPKEKFDEYFEILKQEAIASNDETSDNITKEELADMEEMVNSDLGISHLSEADLQDDNDNVTDDNNDDGSDNMTDDNDTETNSDNVTDESEDDLDNATSGDDNDYDNTTESDDYDNATGDSN